MGMHINPKTADQQVQQQDIHDSELSDFSKVNHTQRKLALRAVRLLLEGNEAHVHHDRAASHKGITSVSWCHCQGTTPSGKSHDKEEEA